MVIFRKNFEYFRKSKSDYHCSESPPRSDSLGKVLPGTILSLPLLAWNKKTKKIQNISELWQHSPTLFVSFLQG